MKSYEFNDYIIEFPEDAHHEIYDEGWCRGIKFFKDTWRFDVLNSIIGERLLINCVQTYHNRDIPFNLSTASFLPDYVKVSKKPA